MILTHNASARVIRSNQSLVLQKVTRSSSGNYSCSAVNSEGETVSNHLQLRVKCERIDITLGNPLINPSSTDAPICVTDKVIIVGAFRNENLNILCEVFADPPPKLVQLSLLPGAVSYCELEQRVEESRSLGIDSFFVVCFSFLNFDLPIPFPAFSNCHLIIHPN